MRTWRVRGLELSVVRRPLLMGIVNATPDSFSDGGAYDGATHGRRLAREGADILDVGGESTRPGAQAVDAHEEVRRVVPVVRALAQGHVVSVDTRKASVAREALAAGAHIVNDVTAGRDRDMFPLVAREGAGLVLMHMLGEPHTMQEEPHYGDVVKEVAAFLVERARAAQAAGVARESIAIDPGIGFGKTSEHNLALLRGLSEFTRLGYPVLVGASRKAFLGKLTAFDGTAPPPQDRLEGTLAAHLAAVQRGADIIRAHDVLAHRRAFAVQSAIDGRE